MTDASHITLLPQLLAHVRAAAPQVQLEAMGIDANTAQLLRSGEADLALGLIPELEADFYQQALFPQDWICLAGARHPRIGKSLNLSEYKVEAHIKIRSGTGHQLLESALAKQRIQRRVLLELPGFLGLGAILSTTDLLITLPRNTGETLAGVYRLRLFPCPFPIPSFTVKQHWHARYHNDAGNRWLRGLCRSLFQQRGIRRGGKAPNRMRKKVRRLWRRKDPFVRAASREGMIRLPAALDSFPSSVALSRRSEGLFPQPANAPSSVRAKPVASSGRD